MFNRVSMRPIRLQTVCTLITAGLMSMGASQAIAQHEGQPRFDWMPPELVDQNTQSHNDGEQLIPQITILKTPMATADASKFKARPYELELKKFNISNDGTNAAATSKGINAALQHAKAIKATYITFPKGTYLIDVNDHILIDLTNVIIDLNGSTLQAQTNSLPKYKVVEFIHGADTVRLTNGTLRGEKDTHDYDTVKSSHEWGQGLAFGAGRNLEVDHITAINFTGDGFASSTSGARNRPELLDRIKASINKADFVSGALDEQGREIDSNEKIRTIKAYDLSNAGGEYEVGYYAGYMGYPYLRGRVYQAYYYDADMRFINKNRQLQYRKYQLPENAKFVRLEFNQPEIPGDIKDFVLRITNLTPSVDVHCHNNVLQENRRLGFAMCGGQRWIIENNQFIGNGGTAPAYGIDFEDGLELVQDVVFRNNTFKGNIAGDLVATSGTEYIFEGNTFEKSVVTYGRAHNYTFRNNTFRGNVLIETRTGVAEFYNNTYEGGSLNVTFDTKAVADGIYRPNGQTVATPPLLFKNETLSNMTRVVGTYLNFENSKFDNVIFTAGPTTRMVRFVNNTSKDSKVTYYEDGDKVLHQVSGTKGTLTEDGPGLSRRQAIPEAGNQGGLGLYEFSDEEKAYTIFRISFQRNFEQWAKEDVGRIVPEDQILAIGSSSFTKWRTMGEDLGLNVLRRGFGGAHMQSILAYKEFFRRYNAKKILVYVGSNDLGGGRKITAQDWIDECKTFVDYIHETSPDTQIYFMAVKLTPARHGRWPVVREANRLLTDYAQSHPKVSVLDVSSPLMQADGQTPIEGVFMKDGIHLTPEGYKIWIKVLKSYKLDA